MSWWAEGCSPDLSPCPQTLLFGLIVTLAAPEAPLFTAPPQFLETPPQVLEVQELEPLTLRCVARGSPQPHVTWKLQGQDIGQGQGQMQVSPGAGQGEPYSVRVRSSPGSRAKGRQRRVGRQARGGALTWLPEPVVLLPSAGHPQKCRVRPAGGIGDPWGLPHGFLL